MSQITYSAIVDGTDLTTVSGLTVLLTNPYAPARRKLSINLLARSNKAKTNSAFYVKRIITVRVGITRATRDLVETSLDSLMALIQGVEKELWLRQSGGTRKYTCTYSDFTLREEGGSYIEMDLFFECSDNFGYDIAPTLLKQVSGFTSGQKTDQITVEGSAPWQAPLFTLTYSAITGGTTATVTIGNGVTGQQVTITRTWTAGDVLVIDSLNKSVKINGVAVAFTGAIPEWSKGIGYINYLDNFTARTFSYTMNYYRRWV